MPDELPGLRHPAGPGRRRATSTSAAPTTRSCPAQLRERLFHLAGRGAFDIEVLGFEAAAALLDARRDHRRGRPVRADEEQLATVPLFTRKDGGLSANGASCWPTSRRPRTSRCGGSSWRCRSATSGRPRPGARREFAASTRSRPTRRSSPRSTASGRRSPSRRRVVRRRLAPRRRRQVGSGRGPDGRRARRVGARTLEGSTVVVTGIARGLSPRRGREAIRRSGGKVTGSVSKKTRSSSSGESPGPKPTRPRWACRCSTRPASRVLLSQGPPAHPQAGETASKG